MFFILFICLLVGLRKNYSTNFRKILRKGDRNGEMLTVGGRLDHVTSGSKVKGLESRLTLHVTSGTTVLRYGVVW